MEGLRPGTTVFLDNSHFCAAGIVFCSAVNRWGGGGGGGGSSLRACDLWLAPIVAKVRGFFPMSIRARRAQSYISGNDGQVAAVVQRRPELALPLPRTEQSREAEPKGQTGEARMRAVAQDEGGNTRPQKQNGRRSGVRRQAETSNDGERKAKNGYLHHQFKGDPWCPSGGLPVCEGLIKSGDLGPQESILCHGYRYRTDAWHSWK